MSPSCRSVRLARPAFLALGVAVALLSLACPSSNPQRVIGPVVFGDEAPTIEFVTPNENFSINRGELFTVTWRDADPDSAAEITIDMVDVGTGTATTIITGIQENDTLAPDEWTINTNLVDEGTYYIRGIITDGINTPFVAFAEEAQGAGSRVIATITPPGLAPSNSPPRVVVTEPSFNQSVAQDDSLTIVVQPVLQQPAAPEPPIPYDDDSDTTLYILVDLDDDPTNDSVLAPDAGEIIILRTLNVAEGASDPLPDGPVVISLATIPARPNGEPYYVRATIDDAVNPQVHAYAPGTVNVVRSAQGEVDLQEIGTTQAGAKWFGFNPGAQLGSCIEGVGDFDADGVDDVLFVAQYGNPRSRGNIGEAYLLYGLDNVRHGNVINVNSISRSIDGCIFEAPAITEPGRRINGYTTHHTLGITDAGAMPDVDGDGRPELLFGMPHVDGSHMSMDFDPGDTDEDTEGGLGCYADLLVNNWSDDEDGLLSDAYFHYGGFATVVSSQNRDAAGLIDPDRLSRTSVGLEFVGQTANTIVRSSTQEAQGPEEGRIHGLRIQAGWYDYIDAFMLEQPPLNGNFGWNVEWLPDSNNDDFVEMVVSAPTNERDILDTGQEFGFLSTHWDSRGFFGSVIVLAATGGTFGDNDIWRDKSGSGGTNTIPIISGGDCSADPPDNSRGGPLIPLNEFEIFAEDVDDWLHDGGYAGDVNLDATPDILMGAPLNDRSAALPDTGATYVLYGRPSFTGGDIELSRADDPETRPPMLRVRGETAGDSIGWKQVRALDVNGDRIDDVVLGAPYTTFGGVLPETCGGDYNGDGLVNDVDINLTAFNACEASFGEEVFFDDACKAFDYNNDRMIDDRDRVVVECLVVGGGVECCPSANGFVGIVFGGVSLDGDRTISQIGTPDLPGVRFYGTEVGDLAGWSVASAGDFNRDNFGDILIAAPGETRFDENGRERLGVAYLIFGGTHLSNGTFSLDQVGTGSLPGIVFVSPFEIERPNEAPILTVAGIGDVNDDSFDDIGIGIPQADFVDTGLPQEPGEPGTDPILGRRPDDGAIYMIYGNNVGSNR